MQFEFCISHLSGDREIGRMTESVEQKMGSNQEPVASYASRLTVFEPEVLAFCCEH